MAKGSMDGVKIAGIVCAVPPQSEDIASVYSDKFGKNNVERSIKIAGVKRRRVAAPGQTASDLCFSAGLELINSLGWEKNEIGALIFVSQTMDYLTPATSAVLQNRLGLSKECLAFDISMGCSGFVYGLTTAAAYVKGAGVDKVLLLLGNMSSKYACPEDRSAAMLFGDAGAAVALECAPSAPTTHFFLKTDGAGFACNIVPAGGFRNPEGAKEPYLHEDECLRSDYCLSMDPVNVFNFSISEVPRSINDFFEEFAIDKDRVDYFVFHQANLHLIKIMAKKVGVSSEKLLFSIGEYGNTSAACIPVTLCSNTDLLKEKPSFKIFAAGYGAGFSYGGVYFSLDTAVPLKMIESEVIFQDGIVSHA